MAEYREDKQLLRFRCNKIIHTQNPVSIPCRVLLFKDICESMLIYKTDEQVEMMRQSAMLVSKTLAEMTAMLKPGITTLSIDKAIGEFIRDHQSIPSFLNYNGYPFNSCISVNDVVVHGFPGKYELREGDIISIDIGVILNGWHGDHAYTFAIGDPGEAVMQLIRVTKVII